MDLSSASPRAPGHGVGSGFVFSSVPAAAPSTAKPPSCLEPEADVLNYCESLALRGFQGGWKLKAMKV